MGIMTKWSEGNVINATGEIGELNIGCGKIAFFLKKYDNILERNFVGNYNDHKYKVYTHGQSGYTTIGYSYFVSKVFQYNGNDYDEFLQENISDIMSFSFEVQELAWWIKHQSVEWNVFGDNQSMAIEKECPIYLLKADNPRIYIKYESKFPFDVENNLNRIALEKKPRIFVEYSELVDDTVVFKDIQLITRFFAVLLGKLSHIEDLRLDIANRKLKMYLYFNYDFSYKSDLNYYNFQFRTNIENIGEDICEYFEKWYAYTTSESNKFISDAYFEINSNRNYKIEELFLTYCKFIEGYHLRKTDVENIAETMSKQLETISDSKSNEIESILKSLGIESELKRVFVEAGSKYKSKNIANWISRGFVERVNLESRIKELDKAYFSIINSNRKLIFNECIDADIYSKIGITRNYFSHFKNINDGILTYAQMSSVANLLEILIIALNLSEMGLKIEEIESILVNDEQYRWYMRYLSDKE